MGCFLRKNGGLTESQKEQCIQLGMKEEDYKEKIIQRLEQLRGGKPPKPFKEAIIKNKITAKNPVLLIGHGSSRLKFLKHYNSFPGPVITVDSSANELYDHGVELDYIVTLESGRDRVVRSYFNRDMIKKHNTKIIHSSITKDNIVQYINEEGKYAELFDFKEEPRCSNVGLFAVCFAREKLKADKIFMTGMEHTGEEYPSFTYRVWQTDFWYFTRQWPKETIVNCSKGGALYYRDYILDCDLDLLELKIE